MMQVNLSHVVAEVEQALAVTSQWGPNELSDVPEKARKHLDRAAKQIPELRFFRTLCEDWETTLYLLMHLAGGTFGVPMAEGLFVRSAGRSGKDSTANLI